MIAALAMAVMVDVVASRPLPKGTILSSGDITAHSPAEADGVLGMQLERPVLAGHTISPAVLSAPDLVHRQDAVSVTFARGGLHLSLPGRSMGKGSLGETVRVLIEGRKRPIVARVVAAGVVEVSP